MEMVEPSDVHPNQVRFIERDHTSRQSTGRILLRRLHARTSGWSSFWADPFHSVIHHSTIKIIAFFCASYLFTHLVFSLIYYMIDASCQLQIESLLDAMYLSLEVGTTIGWGLPGSPYLKAAGARGGCVTGIFIIYLHTLVMQIQNAIMIGLMFCRLSRGTSRAASLIFTDKAVIREMDDGKFYFMFQVCEQRKHQLVEAKVRCYALSTTLLAHTPNGAASCKGSESL
ncbi:G protein-activated inward rectifier potassium channel 2 (GIRK-2) (Potassium channel, partial [Durusdinium trenchii]